MNLYNLVVLEVQWWMLLVPQNSERIVADDLSKKFPFEFPDIEFQKYYPADRDLAQSISSLGEVT